MHQLTESVKTLKVSNSASAATTAITTSAVDTQGYDGIRFIVALGTVTDASVIQLTPYSIATNTTTGGTAVTNATTDALTAATSSNTLIISDVIKPSSRYVYATLTRTAQNAGVDSIVAELYRSRTLPVTASSNVAKQKIGGAI